jgi:hypothetical protein
MYKALENKELLYMVIMLWMTYINGMCTEVWSKLFSDDIKGTANSYMSPTNPDHISVHACSMYIQHPEDYNPVQQSFIFQ